MAGARRDIAPFYVMEVMRSAAERAAAGGDVLHLEVGQPATPAPEGVRRAAHLALDADPLGYTTALGLDVLRARIAEHYREWYGVSVPPERVVVTVGASGGVALTFLAAFEPGDRVAVPAPGYPCYRNMLHAFGVEAVPIRCGPETRFQPTPELLDAAGPLHGVVVASPSNPTGTMLPPEDLAALVAWCDDRGARLVSDEIYHGITFDRPATTALAASDRVVVVNSFSKYFSMTGWRIGWMVVPEDLAVPVERLAQNLFIAAPTLSQHAAVAAFDCHAELRALVDRYAVNRRILLDGLTTAGFDRLAPADGAFYVYAAVDHLTGHHPADDAQDLCATWLRELGVAATPGIDFDPFEGRHHVRFSFAGDAATMTEAVSRLGTWTQRTRPSAPHR